MAISQSFAGLGCRGVMRKRVPGTARKGEGWSGWESPGPALKQLLGSAGNSG